jgi:Holliday junction resolvasome RuvABC ATP-dependent DNA helicase subunit
LSCETGFSDKVAWMERSCAETPAGRIAIDLHRHGRLGRDRDLLHGAPDHLLVPEPGELEAAAVDEERDTIEDVYEPYLLQLGFIQRTPRGRIVTERGRTHIGSVAETANALF